MLTKYGRSFELTTSDPFEEADAVQRGPSDDEVEKIARAYGLSMKTARLEYWDLKTDYDSDFGE